MKKLVVTVGKREEKQEWNYPCLGISEKGYLVLFTKDSEGFVLLGSNYWHKEGTFIDSWEMSCFTPYDGPVTLEMK